MRTTSSFTFFCRQSKVNKQGYAPIECSLIINGERKFINLPRKERPELFNRKRQPKDIQDYLSMMHQMLNEIQTDMLRHNIPLTVEHLRDYLRTGGFKPYSINDLFTEFLSIQKRRVGIDLTQGAYRKYELVRDIFFDKFNKEDEVTTITPSSIQSFYIHLQQMYSTATAASYIAKTKTIVEFGMDNDKIKINPFQNLKVRREKKEIMYLTNEEIERLKTTDLMSPSLDRVRDCFLFQVYSGLSYIDMEHLQPEDIQQEGNTYYIRKKRVKTGVEYTAVLLPDAISILSKYAFKLPVISNQKTNVYLHQIEALSGIRKPLTSHLGRKTYGHILLNSNVRIETVAKALGHSSAKTTAKYYAELTTTSVISEIAKAI